MGYVLEHQKKIFLVLNAFSLLVFSCGLTVSYTLEPPLRGITATGDTSNDITYNEFKFTVNNSGNLSGGIWDYYRGTVIYYKIYNSLDNLHSEQRSINSANTQYSSQGRNRLVDLKYQQMFFSVSNTSTDILAKNTSNMNVTIRLLKEGSYNTGVYVNSSFTYMPERYKRENGFAIFDTANTYVSSFTLNDDDVQFASGQQTEKWYVNAYAVSYGVDSNFLQIYSELLPLGVIKIEFQSNTP